MIEKKEYFAAHAPDKIPNWFNFELEKVPFPERCTEIKENASQELREHINYYIHYVKIDRMSFDPPENKLGSDDSILFEECELPLPKGRGFSAS